MNICFKHLAAVILFFVASPAKADYLPLELGDLFGGSTLIALGTIEGIDDDTFEFRSSMVFDGPPTPGLIEVKRYTDWPDGRRWTGYAPGQTVLLFLDAPDATGSWKIRGLGGEGEMPVINGDVYPHGVNLDVLDRRVYELDGGKLYGYRIGLEAFEAALSGYLRCFTPDPDSICTKEDRETYKESSHLNAYLAASAGHGGQ